MAKSFPNIERSMLRPQEYLGYSDGGVWRIHGKSGDWRAAAQFPTGLTEPHALRAGTLAHLSKMLASAKHARTA